MKTMFFTNEKGEVEKVSLHDVDANHAMEVDPQHWSDTDPSIAPSVVTPIDEIKVDEAKATETDKPAEEAK